MEKITTATKITIARIVLIVPTMILYILGMIFFARGNTVLEITFGVIATALFVILCSSDFIDGHIARKTGTVSELGKFLDPLADKIVVLVMLCLYICFAKVEDVQYGTLYPYSTVVIAILTGIIFSRELTIGVFRAIAAKRGIVLSADKWGKFKTIFLNISVSGLTICHFDKLIGLPILGSLSHAVFYIATILAIVSGLNYILSNKGVLNNND